jgi:hypothetical protein
VGDTAWIVDVECTADTRPVHILEIPLGVKKDSLGIKTEEDANTRKLTLPLAILQTADHNSYPFQPLSSSLLLLTGSLVLFLLSWRIL